MSDKCPNCGSESRDFRGITGMFGTICSDEWHDKATVLDDKDKHIEELENDLETLIKYIAQVDTQNALNSLNDRGVYLRDDAKELTAKYGFFDYWKEGGADD